MGNACGCADSNVGETSGANIKQVERKPAALKLANYQSRFVPDSFKNLSAAEKEDLLNEVLRIIVTQGDFNLLSTQNTTIKSMLARQPVTIPMNKEETYEGECVEGYANGKGKIKHIDGKEFSGFFNAGFRFGKGVSKAQNKLTEQFFGKDGQPQGICVETVHNEGSLACFYDNRKKQGPSFAESKNEIIFGRFLNDERNGLTVTLAKDKKTLSLQEFKDDKPIGDNYQYLLSVVPTSESKGGVEKPAKQAPGQPATK